ncbi:MAG: hypothetical protein AAFN77_03520 [Planctomycetota bacterium]
MKQTLKTRLLAVIAFSSVSLGGPMLVNAQDGFGIIRPATPSQSAPHSSSGTSGFPPIVASGEMESQRPDEFKLPPIISSAPAAEDEQPPIVKPLSELKPIAAPAIVTPARAARDNTPLAFAPSRIQHADFDGSKDNSQNQHVGFATQAEQAMESLPPIVSDATQRGLLPMNELPSIIDAAQDEMPPIVGSSSIPNPVDIDLQPLNLELAPTPVQADSALAPIQTSDAPARDDATDLSIVQGVGYSTAGVPIYSADLPTAVSGTPSIVSSVQEPTQNTPPIVNNEIGGLPMMVPSNDIGPPQPIPLLNAPPMGRSIGSNIDPTYSTGVAPRATQMMSPPPMTTGESYFTPTVTAAPVIQSGAACSGCNGGGCSTCGGGGSVSSCQSCGANGCYNLNAVTGQFNSCGSCSNARRYFIAEALFFDRDDGFISNSNFGTLGNFDWNGGWRFTLGRRSDSTRGREISYMGILPVDQNRNYSSTAGIITSRFTAADGFTAAQTGSFFNATQQSEAKQTFFHSLEFNRVRWGWDVLKTYVGVRYLYVDDSYTMFSQSITNDRGFFQFETRNHLFGPHIGAELFYDIGYRLSFSFFSKAGVYANFNEGETVMFNNGVQQINTEDSGGTVSTSYEAGLTAHYRINRQARFRFGYNILYLGEVASVADNFPRFLTPSTGNVDDSDDMFFHGLSLGFEVYR